MNWGKYTLPFTKDVYLGEFLTPCQSQYYDDYIPMKFVQELLQRAKLITIASEPSFCGGSAKSEIILRDMNEIFLGNELNVDNIKVDYTPDYPEE